MQVMYTFRARCHGAMNAAGKDINQLTRNGNTPTGLVVQIPYLKFSIQVFFYHCQCSITVQCLTLCEYLSIFYNNRHLTSTVLSQIQNHLVRKYLSIFSNYFNRINGSQH